MTNKRKCQCDSRESRGLDRGASRHFQLLAGPAGTLRTRIRLCELPSYWNPRPRRLHVIEGPRVVAASCNPVRLMKPNTAGCQIARSASLLLANLPLQGDGQSRTRRLTVGSTTIEAIRSCKRRRLSEAQAPSTNTALAYARRPVNFALLLCPPLPPWPPVARLSLPIFCGFLIPK